MLLQQLDPLLLFCFPSLTFIVQLIFFFMIRRQPRSTLFPYTTLFRSGRAPERFLPLDITSLLLHVMSKGKDRKSGSAGMPRPISYAVFCLKTKSLQPSACRREPANHTSGTNTDHYDHAPKPPG